jgi:hypothetical protein
VPPCRFQSPAHFRLAPPQAPQPGGTFVWHRNCDLGHLCVSRFALEIVCRQASHPVGWPPRLGPGLLARWLGPQLNFRFSWNTRTFPEYTPNSEIRKTTLPGLNFISEQDYTGKGPLTCGPFRFRPRREELGHDRDGGAGLSTQQRFHVRAAGSFKCQVCRKVLLGLEIMIFYLAKSPLALAQFCGAWLGV